MRLLSPKLGLLLPVLLSTALPSSARAVAPLLQPAPGPSAVLPTDPEGVDPAVLQLVTRHAALVEKTPRDAAAHGELGLVYEANLLWKEAAACFARAVELDPSPGWQLHLAVATRRSGRFAEALALLDQLATESDVEPAVLQRLGVWRLESGDLEGAEWAFRRLVAARPEAPEGHAGLGEMLLRRREFARAAERLESAVAIDPGYRSARYLLGLAYRGLGRNREAVREMSAGARAEVRFLRDPLSERALAYAVNATARIDRAMELLSRAQPARAAELLEQVLELQPDHVTALNDLAIAYMRLGRGQRAFELLTRARAADPDRFSTFVNLASWAMRSNQPEQALRYAELAIERGPHAAPPRIAQGQALLRLGRLAEAADSFEAATRIDPGDPRPLLTLAELEVRLGRLESAFSRLERSVAQWPELLPAQLGLTDVGLALGHVERARASLEAARALAPNDPQVAELAARLEQSARP